MKEQDQEGVGEEEASFPTNHALAIADLGIVGSLVESFESLFDLLAPDQDEIDEELGQYVAAIAADRERLGTLVSEPISEIDVILAGLLALTKRFERGDGLTARQRRALTAMVRLGLGRTMEGLTKERARREASRRGGKAGRTADPQKVLTTWRRKLALCNNKKTEADRETAQELHLSERTVRQIRTANK